MSCLSFEVLIFQLKVPPLILLLLRWSLRRAWYLTASDKTLVSRRATDRPSYLAACSRTRFSGGCVCETVIRRCLKSPRIAESQPLNNVLASQTFPKNRYTNTALRKLRFRTGCEIAWSVRSAARYQGLVPTLSDTVLSLGTSDF